MLIRRTPNWIDRFFDTDDTPLSEFTARQAITLNVHENDEAYTVVAEVPGMNIDDIDIRLHDDVLTLTAETESETTEEHGKALIQERRYGRFSRSLRFPVRVDADNVEADYNDGILTLRVPKAEEAKPRRIEIKHNAN